MRVSKVLFIPFSVIGGILAGIIGKKAFEVLWGVFDDEHAPDPKYREIPFKKLIPACCSRARSSARSAAWSITARATRSLA